ncbi:hypothetical protein PsorP6_003656 [Peronosclerospora sorghi]|uniref:Uncharacterized protein n=1 Tax=Peronosclerospora sorghi TaxID=230839 RepID=A0ACC0VP15_9STRA|nr:hypothetical protein PsorP6_003656 [Peronosclerospora sorghi]
MNDLRSFAGSHSHDIQTSTLVLQQLSHEEKSEVTTLNERYYVFDGTGRLENASRIYVDYTYIYQYILYYTLVCSMAAM